MDFQQRGDIELFVADMNPRSKVRLLTDNFIPVLPVTDPAFTSDLLKKAKANGIQMIIPGGDEEAFALMKAKEDFAKEGIIAAVQDNNMLSIFGCKTAIYDYVKRMDFPVPVYRRVRSKEDFEKGLKDLGYPNRPLLIKPNAARGGRGITILSEKVIPNRDNLAMMDKNLFMSMIEPTSDFLLMEYIEGIVYDIDVLRYKNGEQFFGVRRRFTNVTKLFSGNIFEKNDEILAFSKHLYQVLPTQYLIDYDFLVDDNGKIHLLEINPRPSGSTVSFLPFGVNLYYILAKSYLDNAHIPIDDSMCGQQAVTFFKMVKGAL